MSIYAPGDRPFANVPHKRFGEHCFTFGHSAKQAKGVLIFAVVCGIITAGIYGLTSSEGLKLLGMIPALLFLLAGVLGAVQLVRSRLQFHIYERGIVQQGPRDQLEMPFDRVTEATLDLTEQPGTIAMKFRLRSGLDTLAFNDGTSVVERKSLQRMNELVQHIADRLPRDVELRGLHNVTRSAE